VSLLRPSSSRNGFAYQAFLEGGDSQSGRFPPGSGVIAQGVAGLRCETQAPCCVKEG